MVQLYFGKTGRTFYRSSIGVCHLSTLAGSEGFGMRFRDRKMSVRLANIICNADIFTERQAAKAFHRWLNKIGKPRNFGVACIKEMSAMLKVEVVRFKGDSTFPEQFIINKIE